MQKIDIKQTYQSCLISCLCVWTKAALVTCFTLRKTLIGDRGTTKTATASSVLEMSLPLK